MPDSNYQPQNYPLWIVTADADNRSLRLGLVVGWEGEPGTARRYPVVVDEAGSFAWPTHDWADHAWMFPTRDEAVECILRRRATRPRLAGSASWSDEETR